MSSSPENMTKVKLGICAMAKKANSLAMKSILENLEKFTEFKIIIFSEETIFKKEIEDWPIVDALIIFFSDGFPYNKGLKYINLRKPFLVNDFEIQKVFWDRVKVLKMLEEEGIPTPNHIIIDRGDEINNDGESNNNLGELNTSAEKEKKVNTYKKEINCLIKENRISDLKLNLKKGNYSRKDIDKNKLNLRKNSSGSNSFKNGSNNAGEVDDELIEFDDHIEYRGKKLFKPFVEKPFNGDDHNIYVYYPPNLGGGHKRLFRKTKEYSSLYFPNLNEIRRDKSYIYEEFLQSDGFDVKVYTIGPDNAHAEERKSPTLDGKVNRSAEGKEVRYPINLTKEEKEFARKIVLKFKQNICGFDILRCQGNSYVCDVNGFSFVKGNQKYYRDCTNFLRKFILHGLKKDITDGIDISVQPIFPTLKIHSKKQNKSSQNKEELRSIIAVFRHGDRSPKEKMKLIVEDQRFLNLFEEFGKSNTKKEIKLKKAKELSRVLEIVNEILDENKNVVIGEDNFCTRIFQIKMVLERKIHFDGLTRKIQMKPLKFNETIDETTGKKIIKITQALLILKWGGSLTHAGIEQAYKLGNTFLYRLYPSNQENKDGLIRLHLTYRHDLKCYSADEGRCLKTSASFLKGLLKLDGPIIPIISSMVRQDEDVNKLLDDSESIHEFKGKIKERLSECLNYDGNLKDKFYSLFTKESVLNNNEEFSDEEENKSSSSYSSDELSKKNENKNPLDELMDKIGNPLTRMKKIYSLMKKVIKNIQSFLSNNNDNDSSYFITDKSQILKREYDADFSKKKLIEKILGEDINDEKIDEEKDPNLNERKYSEKILSQNLEEKLEVNPELKEENDQNKNENENEKESYDKETIQILNEANFDCKEEKVILIYKRYVKLKKDFFNQKKNLFDISKIPDIYDNIKYDIIHNKNIINESGYQLYNEVSLLANFVMPLEYGITKDEKINIGLKIIKPLLKKMYSDLNVILQPNQEKEGNVDQKEDKNWSGLDTTKVNDNEIKSLKRHVKSRFYFTCASHMYALLNIIGYENNSFLTHKNKKAFEKLRKIFDLDYCSHIIFRLSENLNVDLDNPNRFKLEIIMSTGSSGELKSANKNHLIDVSPWIVLNENLNLTQMKEFLNNLNKD